MNARLYCLTSTQIASPSRRKGGSFTLLAIFLAASFNFEARCVVEGDPDSYGQSLRLCTRCCWSANESLNPRTPYPASQTFDIHSVWQLPLTLLNAARGKAMVSKEQRTA